MPYVVLSIKSSYRLSIYVINECKTKLDQTNVVLPYQIEIRIVLFYITKTENESTAYSTRRIFKYPRKKLKLKKKKERYS